MTFKPNDPCHEHGYCMVCSNDPILCKLVRLEMTNNVIIRSFHFICIKNSLFIFQVQKMSFFMKQLPKIILMIEPTQFIKLQEHFVYTITLIVYPKNCSMYF
jgi:hypothetical protein